MKHAERSVLPESEVTMPTGEDAVLQKDALLRQRDFMWPLPSFPLWVAALESSIQIPRDSDLEMALPPSRGPAGRVVRTP